MERWESALEALGIPSWSFWQNKRVLVTGHTGFKGTWLINWLNELGATTAGLSFSGYPNTVLGEVGVPTHLNLDSDIRGRNWQDTIATFQPEIVFHLAAQSLVYTGFTDPLMTFETNVVGSMHVLELLKIASSIHVAVIITTDKVYQIKNAEIPRTENDPLGGNDPYSASKGAAELIVAGWPISSHQSLLTARSGNVIGGGDDAQKRLIPDLVRAWHSGQAATLRSPEGVRPWLHVLEPLRGYLLLAEHGYKKPSLRDAYNFAPNLVDQVKVAEIAQRTLSVLPPRLGFEIRNQAEIEFIETKELLLDATKAELDLKWVPVWGWKKAIDKTLKWYEEFHQGVSADYLYKADINSYVQDLKECSVA